MVYFSTMQEEKKMCFSNIQKIWKRSEKAIIKSFNLSFQWSLVIKLKVNTL